MTFNSHHLSLNRPDPDVSQTQYTQNGTDLPLSSGFGELQSTQPRQLEDHWGDTSKPSPVAPGFGSGAASGTTHCAGSGAAELWNQCGYDFDNLLSMLRTSTNNLGSIDTGALEFAGGFDTSDEQQGLDVLPVSRGPVDERTYQQTSNPNEGASDVQGTSKQKSCWQCRFKHEKCAGGTPCKNCEDIKRRKGPYRYTVPCFRNRLVEFTPAFFPGTLKGPILPLVWYNDHISHFKNDPFPGNFSLPISVGFGEPIQIHGRRIDAQGEVLTRSRTIKTNNDESSIVSEDILPIRPGRELKDLYSGIEYWLNNSVQRVDVLSAWVDTVKRNKIHSFASSNVLLAICHYFTECIADFAPSALSELSADEREARVAVNSTLQHAMRAAILATVLSTRLQIAPEGLDGLQVVFGMERDELSRKRGIPQLMNKAFKYAVFGIKLWHTHHALLGLDKLLCQKDTPEGQVGCIVTLLTTAMSSTQLSLVDLCCLTQGTEGAVAFEHVKNEILELESVFSKLRCLFHRRYKIEHIREERRFQGLDKNTQELVGSLSEAIPALRENTSGIDDLQFENMEHIKDLALGNNVPKDIAQFNADRLFYDLWGLILTDDSRKRKSRN
ncbi:hypothetical protein GX51_07998 [Blastomyces parvus]|uniref:Zn(2)-C6 fungal-type domain-containing protein n=1 Tax=Blastomyces parvus TaxID=2060905 RepID=A0A2B7WHI4_9EURO|nr:hypothetical protein GX51_07998 [Blastomyces parvus]